MAVVDISGKEGVWVYPAFPYMKLCRDVVLRQGYPPEELLYIDEKKDGICSAIFRQFCQISIPGSCFFHRCLKNRLSLYTIMLSGPVIFSAFIFPDLSSASFFHRIPRKTNRSSLAFSL